MRLAEQVQEVTPLVKVDMSSKKKPAVVERCRPGQHHLKFIEHNADGTPDPLGGRKCVSCDYEDKDMLPPEWRGHDR